MRKKEERRGQTLAPAEMKGQEISWWLEQAQRKSRQRKLSSDMPRLKGYKASGKTVGSRCLLDTQTEMSGTRVAQIGTEVSERRCEFGQRSTSR